MTTDTRLALALDELLHDPRYAELAHAVTQTIPVGELDQHQAANRHADEVLTLIADHVGGTRQAFPTEAVPEWVRLGLLQTWAAYCMGTVDTCLHSPVANRPQPVMAAAWRPGLVTCLRCVGLLAVRDGTVAALTCDGCGHVCGGVDAGDPIFPNTLVFASLVYKFGTCGGCRFGPAETAR